MAKARTPNPSRIGKTLGAILSAPRRSATDESDEADASEPESSDVRGATDTAPPADVAGPPTPAHAAAGVPDAGAPVGALPANPAPLAAAATDAAGPLSATAHAATASNATPPDDTPRATADEAVLDTDADVSAGGTRRKKRETFLVPEELADAMRNAIVHLSGPPLYYTLAEFGEHAIRSYIAQLEREHNAGQPFPRRPRAVRQGRPLR